MSILRAVVVSLGVSMPALFAAAATMSAASDPSGLETIILMHGLGRTSRSMQPMQRALEDAGFAVENFGYPSRSASVEGLSKLLAERIDKCCTQREHRRLGFVVHSLGGIVVRAYARAYGVDRIGRVVMLATPNAGSEVVDLLRGNLLFRYGFGPAATQLGTRSEDLPRSLGPVGFEVGVIAGRASINPIFSGLLPGEDDGTVAVESTRVEGMKDFIVVPHTHTFIMNSREVQSQAASFLRTGGFVHAEGHAETHDNAGK